MAGQVVAMYFLRVSSGHKKTTPNCLLPGW
jgi:hypothetical protein